MCSKEVVLLVLIHCLLLLPLFCGFLYLVLVLLYLVSFLALKVRELTAFDVM